MTSVHKCLHNVVVGAEDLCQPTMEPSGQGPSPSPATAGRSSLDCPSMEIPASTPSIDARSTCTAPASRVEYFRQRYKKQPLSEKAMELMLSSRRGKSSKAYKSQFQKWASWCGARSINPISCPIGDVVNFLAHMFSEGYHSMPIDQLSLRCMTKSMNMTWGSTHLYKTPQRCFSPKTPSDALHAQLPTLEPMVTTNISLQDWSHKLAMLMALTRPSRLADLASLDLQSRSYSVEGVTFQPNALSKQSKQQKHGTEFFFSCYPADDLSCPVLGLKEYENRKKQISVAIHVRPCSWV